MEPKVKHVMFAEAPFALKRLSSITKPAAKKDMPKTKSMFERMEPAWTREAMPIKRNEAQYHPHLALQSGPYKPFVECTSQGIL